MKMPLPIDDAIIPVVDPCRPLACPAIYDASRPFEVEVGCGKGRFLAGRAARHPECEYLGIERMLDRVRSFARKVARGALANAHVLRLEALYAFHYLLPAHHARRVYVFFPDPWPKRKHWNHRLFSPAFLDALWMRLECGGTVELATDHAAYFEAVGEAFAADDAARAARGLPPRFVRTDPMPRPPEDWTEFEAKFRAEGLAVHAAAWRAAPIPDETPLEPLRIPPECEPKALAGRDFSPDETINKVKEEGGT